MTSFPANAHRKSKCTQTHFVENILKYENQLSKQGLLKVVTGPKISTQLIGLYPKHEKENHGHICLSSIKRMRNVTLLSFQTGLKSHVNVMQNSRNIKISSRSETQTGLSLLM